VTSGAAPGGRPDVFAAFEVTNPVFTSTRRFRF
jgi:hypothetical protein